MKCLSCSSPQDRSATLIPGVVVLRCKTCKTLQIEGDTISFPGGDGVMDELRKRAQEILGERRHKEMVESDIDDPRWERVL